MPTQKSNSAVALMLTSNIGDLEGLNRRKDFKEFDRVIQIRHFRVLHTFQHMRLELKTRGWNKVEASYDRTKPWSLLYLYTYSQLRASGGRQTPEFNLTTKICYHIMDEVASTMSRKKYTSVEEWEQAQNSLDNIQRFIDKCIERIVAEIA